MKEIKAHMALLDRWRRTVGPEFIDQIDDEFKTDFMDLIVNHVLQYGLNDPAGFALTAEDYANKTDSYQRYKWYSLGITSDGDNVREPFFRDPRIYAMRNECLGLYFAFTEMLRVKK